MRISLTDPDDPQAWDDAQKDSRKCGNPFFYFVAAVVLGILLLAAVFAVGYVFGKARGYEAGAQYVLDETAPLFAEYERLTDDLLADTANYQRLTTDLMRDLEAKRQWSTDFAFKAADWIQGAQDPTLAHDLLWCAMGLASPLDNCLQQLSTAHEGT